MSDFATFEELAGDHHLHVTVMTDYGDVRRFRLKIPSFIEWNETWYRLRDVPIPNTRAGANGKEPNPLDTEYRAKQADVDMRRKLLIVAHALAGGGMAIPGETLEEKADALGRKWDGAIINALFTALKGAYEGGQAYRDDAGAVFRTLREIAAKSHVALQHLPDGVGEDERPVESGPDSV